VKLTATKTILYIDDDQDDIELLQRAIDSLDSRFQMLTAFDGEEGLQQLSILHSENRLPSLIVLDINMPRMDGRMTFLNLKADEHLSTIPIVVFSTSNSPLDRLFFERGNVEYITKPVSFDHLVTVAKRLLSYMEE
jgi:CheY-like chemotaxis protein